jgi:CshA-type fibril repeat protein
VRELPSIQDGTYGYHPSVEAAVDLARQYSFDEALVLGTAVPDLGDQVPTVRLRTDLADVLTAGTYWFFESGRHLLLVATDSTHPGEVQSIDPEQVDEKHPLIHARGWYDVWWDEAVGVEPARFAIRDDVVVLPGRQDAVIRKRAFRAGSWVYEVRVDGRMVSTSESSIEPQPVDEDAWRWIESAPEPAEGFGATLTRAKLNGRLSDTVFSYRATRTIAILTDGGAAVSSVTVAGGVYTLSGGTITFTPSAGYLGTAAPVTYRVTNTAGLTGTATYTPTVLKPAAPAPVARFSSGAGEQHATIPAEVGETIALLDLTGVAAGSVTVVGVGTYTLDAAIGIVTFTPLAGFVGVAAGVTFRISDTYDQSGESLYIPTVTPVSPKPPVVKPLPKIGRSKLVKVPAEPKSVKGKEKMTKAFNSSFAGIDAYPITKLAGRQLLKGEAATLSGDGLFDFDSGKLTKKGRAEVKAVVKNLRGSQTVHCEGYTDYAGDRSHEFDLSLQRAKAVCTALKKYGAEVVTMTRGYGPKRPAVVGGTAKSRKGTAGSSS